MFNQHPHWLFQSSRSEYLHFTVTHRNKGTVQQPALLFLSLPTLLYDFRVWKHRHENLLYIQYTCVMCLCISYRTKVNYTPVGPHHQNYLSCHLNIGVYLGLYPKTLEGKKKKQEPCLSQVLETGHSSMHLLSYLFLKESIGKGIQCRQLN